MERWIRKKVDRIPLRLEDESTDLWSVNDPAIFGLCLCGRLAKVGLWRDCLVGIQAFTKDPLVPFGYRNLFRGRCNPIPEGLNKINLFLDEEIVKSWRGSGDYFGHDQSSYGEPV